VTVAKSLKVRVVTAGVAPAVLDQSAFWPDANNPKWFITCNEEGVTSSGLVRINIATGQSTTIVTGTTSCDPVRATPWGTILFGEEAGGGPNGGRMYELIDPLNTTGVTLNRATGAFTGGTGASNLAARQALGRLSFEGLAIYGNGVTYFGDENRPTGVWAVAPTSSSSPPPSATRAPAPSPASTSRPTPPLARCSACAPAVATSDRATSWARVPGSRSPPRQTLTFGPRRRRCTSPAVLAPAVPEVRRLVQGSPALAMPDNIAWQPGRGNWIIHEDADTNTALQGPHNNDLWDCLPDGADPDLQSDGCVRIGTLNDLTAEWTGGIFDASGQHFYVSVQHNISGFGTILDISGWQ
jgi:secreted PhoX family phosphatase